MANAMHHHVLDEETVAVPVSAVTRTAHAHGRDASNLPESQRKLSVVAVAFVTYLAVAGGPFGIETAVGAAGPFPTIIGVVLLAVLWELPQALMTAELSTMFPSNAGYVGWVSRGLGPFWGVVNAFNSLACNLLDLPIYPVLVADYATQIFDAEDGGVLSWCVKGGALALMLALNLWGVEVVATSSVFFTFLLLLPFVVQLFLVELKPEAWTVVSPDIDWITFASATLWSVQGFDSLGCIAGEVKNAKRTYPLGVSLATALITLNYLIPVMVGVSAVGDYDEWRADDDDRSAAASPSGGGINFASVGKAIAPWMGVWVLISATVANLAEFSALMTTSSRALQHAAEYGMLPSCLACASRKGNTPIVATLFQAAVVAGLMTFDFSQLVVLDTLFNNISLLLEVASFLYLKHAHPGMSRPYAVPFGRWGAWGISVPKILVIASAVAVLGLTPEGRVQLGIGVGGNVLFAAFGWWWTTQTDAGRAWARVSGSGESDTEGTEMTEATSLLGGSGDRGSLPSKSDGGSTAAHGATLLGYQQPSRDASEGSLSFAAVVSTEAAVAQPTTTVAVGGASDDEGDGDDDDASGGGGGGSSPSDRGMLLTVPHGTTHRRQHADSDDEIAAHSQLHEN